MPSSGEVPRVELLPGTLDLIVLRTLTTVARLANIDLKVLEALVAQSIAEMKRRYPASQ